jgi:probable addiction module antidote protein
LRRRQGIAARGHKQGNQTGERNETVKLSKYDIADYLDDNEMVAAYLDLAFESGDLSRIATALGNVARARGMIKIAKATGLSREQLYRTLSAKGKPELATVLKVMTALGGGLKSDFRTSKRRTSGPRAKSRKAA